MNTIANFLGHRLARFLSQKIRQIGLVPATSEQKLLACLQPGDVFLVEGHTRFSSAIQYLTQSTWSHSAMFVGFRWINDPFKADHCFIEADVQEGVRSVSLQEFSQLQSRICRPVGLSFHDREALCQFVINRIGYQYDLKNVWDLVRYLFPTPPVSKRMRRQLLERFGSGDPTRAICSTLIAQAFENLAYPILPNLDYYELNNQFEQPIKMKHFSYIVPRDFDVSPYFQVIKPTLELGFDFRSLK